MLLGMAGVWVGCRDEDEVELFCFAFFKKIFKNFFYILYITAGIVRVDFLYIIVADKHNIKNRNGNYSKLVS